MKPGSVASLLFAVGIGVAPGIAAAQDFPSQPVHIITAEAGATNDLQARAIAPGLSELLGQPVVIENRGGSGVIPISAVATAEPDGHTLLVFGGGVWQLPLMQSVSYDPVEDIAPIAMMTTAPVVLVVNASLDVDSVEDLIAMAKAEPGVLSYGSGATGGITHLSAELFKDMAEVDIERVAYSGAAQAVTALLSGEVQMAFVGVNTARAHVESGALKALGVSSTQPSSVYPGVPPIAEAGVPGYSAATVQGIFAPGGTPKEVIDLLNADIVEVLNRPEIKEQLASSGAEVVGSTPEEFAAYIAADTENMRRVVEVTGLNNQ